MKLFLQITQLQKIINQVLFFKYAIQFLVFIIDNLNNLLIENCTFNFIDIADNGSKFNFSN